MWNVFHITPGRASNLIFRRILTGHKMDGGKCCGQSLLASDALLDCVDLGVDGLKNCGQSLLASAASYSSKNHKNMLLFPFHLII